MQLPIEFEKRMKSLLGGEYDAFHAALCQEEPVKGLRVNERKIAIEAFEENAPFPLEPLPYVRGGYIVSAEAGAGRHPCHHAGAYYMQDPGAMSTIAALPESLFEREGLKILDLCAAPGGKTTQLAARCPGGTVLANEYNAARSRILAGNVERMGLSNVCVTNTDSKALAGWYPGFFDLVVVDAPCSGEGMYRKNDLAISEWSPANVAMCAARQREILDSAAVCVAAGGYLLYSTCTYATEENEEIIAEFLENHPTFHLIPVSTAVAAHTADGIDVRGGKAPELALCRRFYPHVSPGEGQFAALLMRDADDLAKHAIVKDARVPLSKADKPAIEAFLDEAIGRTLPGLHLCGGNIAALDAPGFPLPPSRVVASGVTLGELRRGRIAPHHHFFMAFGGDFLSKCLLALDDPAVIRYIAGEEIDVPASCSGYTAVQLDCGGTALTLGGGKASGGRLKNYYPKGLRVR